MIRNACLICLLFSSGCSLFQRVDPLQVQYDLQKKDRPAVQHINCDCDDPDVMVLPDVEPFKKETEKGNVLISNDDYEDLSDITDQDIKWMKQVRTMKRCHNSCTTKYNLYIDSVNATP